MVRVSVLVLMVLVVLLVVRHSWQEELLIIWRASKNSLFVLVATVSSETTLSMDTTAAVRTGVFGRGDSGGTNHNDFVRLSLVELEQLFAHVRRERLVVVIAGAGNSSKATFILFVVFVVVVVVVVVVVIVQVQ